MNTTAALKIAGLGLRLAMFLIISVGLVYYGKCLLLVQSERLGKGSCDFFWRILHCGDVDYNCCEAQIIKLLFGGPLLIARHFNLVKNLI